MRTLMVDSKGVVDTITTLHDGREYRLRQTVQQLRDSFAYGDLNKLRWVPSKANIADALTKFNPNAHYILQYIAISGELVLPDHQSIELD